jgi:site-specific DNA-methyltransferase (adenine-specific)
MNKPNEKPRGERNRTIVLSEAEKRHYQKGMLRLTHPVSPQEIENKTINQDLFETLNWLPASFVDLVFVDPPYNLTKSFNTTTFKERSIAAYAEWIESWFPALLRTLKPGASVYFCGDWRSPNAETRETPGAHLTRQLQTWRFDPRPLLRFRHNICCRQKTWPQIRRY